MIRHLAPSSLLPGRLVSNGGYKGYHVLALLLAAQTCFGGYSFSRTVTIDHTKVPNTDQANFTVLISGTYSYLATVGNGGNVQSASGYDVAFGTTSNCSSLVNWDQETWTDTTGLVNYWVKIASVSHTTDTVFYMCYGDAGVVSFQGGATGTAWDQASRIYHCPDGTTLTCADYSVNATLNTSSTLTNHAATAVAGQIDGGVGTDLNKYLHDDAARGGGSTGYANPPLTFSVWVKTTFGSNAPFVTFGTDTGGNQCMLYSYVGGGNKALFFEGSTLTVTSTSTVNDGNWHYLVGVADNANSANNSHIYFDGALEATGTISWNIFIGSATDQLTVGRLGGGTQPMTGSVDEIHIINTNRGADWIATEYNNQKTPSTFYAIGAPVSITGTVKHRVIM